VRRVLTLQDKYFRPLPRPAKGERRPFPDWASYRPNSIWIYDSTHFTRCGMTVLIIEDLVSRKWLTHLVSIEETHTQVENAFMAALDAQGLLQPALDRAGTGRVDPDLDLDDGLSPILLAVFPGHGAAFPQRPNAGCASGYSDLALALALHADIRAGNNVDCSSDDPGFGFVDHAESTTTRTLHATLLLPLRARRWPD